MKQVLKENLVLVTGIVLPLILCVVFFVAQKASVMGIDPPKTAVVFADQGLENNPVWAFGIQEGQLHLYYTPPEKGDYWYPPTIYVFDPKTDVVQPHKVPSDIDKKQKADIVLDGLKGFKISTEIKSPDGFVFETNYDTHGGLMTELFSGGRYRYGHVLKKDGFKASIPLDNNTYSATFIGWVTP